ncbi:MAG: AI-2E family transporter [Lachnospiraceae bacterium]|nr:AI-2E family transporter [Lachnospiraceae bacterium]
MELSKDTIRKLRWLIVFTALVVVAFINYKRVFQALLFCWNIIFPFVLGGAMAFIIHAPMQFFERNLFTKRKYADKPWAVKLARPGSLLLSLAVVAGILMVVIFVVAPELGSTFVSLGKTIQNFLPQVQSWGEQLFRDNPDVVNWIENLDFNWDKMIQTGIEFLRSGAGNVLSSTFVVAKTVVSGLTNFFIGFVFACYILLQKEKLSAQIVKAFYAFLPRRTVVRVLKVCSLTNKVFKNFLTGQCVEAVILGTMFFVAMWLLRFPYALLVGILIAFTALIPIFGAFIGCIIGAFLILMVSPVKALLFVVLFLVLQQIEGNLIYPHVVGGSVGLPSIWVLMAVTVGGSLMGVIGMLIFIPITSVVYTLFREAVYVRLRRKKIKV